MSFLKYIVASQISAKDGTICFNQPIGTVGKHNLLSSRAEFFSCHQENVIELFYSLWQASLLINRNKRRGLHKKRVPIDCLGPNMAAILSIVLEPQHGGHDVM